MTALDIIIVNYNTRHDLAACLTSLREAPPTRPHHIVVVDNASSDGSADDVRARFDRVTLIEMGRNAGFAAANNAGIRATAAPLVLLLNSDTLVPAGALDQLCDRLEATGATAVGPRIVDAHGDPELSWGPMLTPLNEWRQGRLVRRAERGDAAARAHIARRTSTERDVDWVSGACLLVRRDAAVRAGLLDERFFMYEEDVDFCAALRAQGGRVLFTPVAEITHLRGRSMSTAAPRKPSHYDESHLRFYAKHAPRWVPLLTLWKRLRSRL
jgi:N-acetylglucosaminyl-diphospho-decaprenol L-rhamnosyltransferase